MSFFGWIGLHCIYITFYFLTYTIQYNLSWEKSWLPLFLLRVPPKKSSFFLSSFSLGSTFASWSDLKWWTKIYEAVYATSFYSQSQFNLLGWLLCVCANSCWFSYSLSLIYPLILQPPPLILMCDGNYVNVWASVSVCVCLIALLVFIFIHFLVLSIL